MTQRWVLRALFLERVAPSSLVTGLCCSRARWGLFLRAAWDFRPGEQVRTGDQRTARMLGIPVPPSLLALADEEME
jgi:hypothetical protein